MTEEIKLTEYSHGGGCGCKIAPQVLDEILHTHIAQPAYSKLLVGNESRDDAAVYDMGNGTAIISTTDFFMPIVNDAYDFGRIASANAISDVYAMGGTPLMAIAVLGWPVNKLPAHVAQRVLEGSRAVCAEAGIPLAGGHSIDSPEPIFGLAVTGMVDKKHLKQNNTARQGDLLYFTKALGVGILSTAQKRKVLTEVHAQPLIRQMTTLNKLGEALGKMEGVHAMTDVTGFGLTGHLSEMAEGSDLAAEIYYSQIKKLEGVQEYLAQKIMPGATARNWSNVKERIFIDAHLPTDEVAAILPDPQTNGGLLVAVDPVYKPEIENIFNQHGLQAYNQPIGVLTGKGEFLITVK